MMDWSALDDACGCAEHVPGLLDRFEDDPSGVWSELMDHLCPQLDTAFTASFAALPRLSEMATACSADDQGWVLLAASAIAACSPGVSEPDSPLTIYATSIAVLRDLADRRLSQAADPEEYVNLLQALLSFEGVEVWDRCLDGLHTGEYEVDCPYCGVNVLLVVGRDDGFCTSDEDALSEAQTTFLRPALAQDLEGLPRTLFARASADGQASVALGIRYVFGRADCPDCGTDFSVPERVTARWVP